MGRGAIDFERYGHPVSVTYWIPHKIHYHRHYSS